MKGLLLEIAGMVREHKATMVDGVLVLHHQKISIRAIRQIEVREFKGSDHLQGEHLFKISEQGVRVYPRAESLAIEPRPVSDPK